MSVLDPVLKQLTVANQLTLLRLFAVPALALALLEGSPGVALALFVGAAITDRLDGIAARRLGQTTSLGMILDPMADKLMMLTTYVIMTVPDHPRSFLDFELRFHVPAWLTLLIVARDLLIVIIAGALYLTEKQVRFPPSRLGKWATGTYMVTAGVFLCGEVWSQVPDALLWFGVYVVGTMTVASGVHYLLRTARLLREIDEQRA